MKELVVLGNEKLLEKPKVAFMASRRVASEEVLRCYDWATEQAKTQQCVVSGFSSKLEKDVLHFLLKGKCPVIVVLARRMYAELPEEWQTALNEGRMLIVAVSQAVRQSQQTAMKRNHYVVEISKKVYLAGVTENSTLFHFMREYPDKCILIKPSSQLYDIYSI